MNVRDLYQLVDHTLNIISTNDPGPLYSELVGYLATMQTSPTPELKTNITNTIEKISVTNYTIESDLLVLPHIEYLEETTVLFTAVGVIAAERVEELWRTDQYFAQPEIEKISTEYTDVIAMLQDTKKTLGTFTHDDGTNDEALVTFTLGGEKSIDTTGQLQYRLTELDAILHGFARLAGDPKAFGSPQIRSLSKSSPGMIDLVSAVKDAAQTYGNEIHLIMLAKGITWVLARIEQIQKIKLNHAELKANNITNPKIDEGFNDLIDEQFSDQELDTFSDELIAKSPPSTDDSAGAHNEIHKAVKTSVKKLSNFMQKGGQAKVYIPPRTSEETINGDFDEKEVEELLHTQSTTQRVIESQAVKLKQLSDGVKSESLSDSPDDTTGQ